QLKGAGRLPHMVAIALGSDCCVTQDQIDEALAILGPGRLLVFVTPVRLGGGDGSGAAEERATAAAHPGRVLLLDWVRESAGHPDWFAPDRLHLNTPGVSAFTQLLSTVLPYAYVPCPGANTGKAVRTSSDADLAARAAGGEGATRTAGHRLIVRMDRRGRVGTSVTVRFSDLWHTSATSVRVCTTPPGGIVHCSRVPLAAGEMKGRTTVALPRPG